MAPPMVTVQGATAPGTLTLQSSDGTSLFARVWAPEGTQARQAAGQPATPRGVVCLVHGAGEHSGRYGHVAAAIVGAGCAVLALDLRGHGASGGARGHTPSYDALLEDVDAALAAAEQRWPGVPRVLYGHSMGGNVVLTYTLRRRPTLAGVIATSPWLRLASAIPRWKEVLAAVMDRVLPSLAQHTGLDTSALSRDPAMVYRGDPLVHDLLSARLYRSICKAGEWALAHAAEFPVPLLLIHGTEDRITSSEATAEFARQLPGRCELVLWEGFYHETHNDLGRERVLEALVAWLKAHLPPAP